MRTHVVTSLVVCLGLFSTASRAPAQDTKPDAPEAAPEGDKPTAPAPEGDKPTAPAPEGEKADPEAEAAEFLRKVSLAIGFRMGKSFAQQGGELDMDAFVKGLDAGLNGGEAPFDDAEADALMRKFQLQIAEKQRKKQAEQAEKNKAEGLAFLAENKGKEGVVTTDSGLQYKVVTEGTGAQPAATDRVKVHYHGTLIDGTVFDSSVDRGEPAQFPLNGVIKGWTEGLQLMKVGGKTRFFVPSELAYGANPRPGGPIGPNAVLIFDVELLEILGGK